ncbi:MAG TPA: PEGA domain-containing protein [Vicinamibacterales bacterium]|nr:PEGA domain-containing protein [Vicinamibacterales bacterium]
MQEHEPRVPPLVIVLAGLTGLVLLAVLLIWAFGGREAPPAQPETAAPASPAPPPTTAAPPPAPEPEPETVEKTRPRRRAAPSPKPAPEPAAPTTGELRIDSDVPGAMVFLDRKYIGETPVTARDVPPGPHQLNLSADGFDGYSQTIEVAPGPAEVMVRFKEIRLNEAVDVVHKHGVGSCEGRLVATPKGLRYETTNKNDAFSLGFDQIETFEVDYLNKNLRVKRRGGKTWNFTTRHDTADPLFVFHREVEKVRSRLAKTGS